MFLIYLVTLVVAAAAIGMFLRASEDVYAVLAAATALICGIWSLAIAPWPLLLLLALGVIAWEKYFLSGDRKCG